MSEPAARPGSPSDQKRWRDDPLSMFLAISAVLLAVMYFYEQRGLTRLDEANARAQEISVELALARCTAGAASTDGETLVLECDRPSDDVLLELAERPAALDSFTTLVIANSDEIRSCPIAPDWPPTCATSAPPSSAELQKARRGSRPGN